MGRFLYQFNSCVLSAIKAILSANVSYIPCSPPFRANAVLPGPAPEKSVARLSPWPSGTGCGEWPSRAILPSQNSLAWRSHELLFSPGNISVEKQVKGGKEVTGDVKWQCGVPAALCRVRCYSGIRYSLHTGPLKQAPPSTLLLSPHRMDYVHDAYFCVSSYTVLSSPSHCSHLIHPLSPR